MTKQVIVSGAEQKAARYLVKSNTAKGRAVSRSVAKIAEAKSAGGSAQSSAKPSG